MVVASLMEGFSLALMISTLQRAGVDIGSHSEAGRFAAWVRATLAALGLRPTLLVMLGLFVVVVCIRAILSTAQGEEPALYCFERTVPAAEPVRGDQRSAVAVYLQESVVGLCACPDQ
jgi:hypothetical protein